MLKSKEIKAFDIFFALAPLLNIFVRRIMTTNYISSFFINIYLWKQDISIEDIRIASGALNVLFDISLLRSNGLSLHSNLSFTSAWFAAVCLALFFFFFTRAQWWSGDVSRQMGSSWMRAPLQSDRCLWSLTRKILLCGFHFIISTSLSLFCSYWNVNEL